MVLADQLFRSPHAGTGIQHADMRAYLDLLSHILKTGVDKDDRTGVGTRSVFGYQANFDLDEGFPLVTTQKMPIRAVVCDMRWRVSGRTNIDYLNDQGVHIWDPWADEKGDVGPVYGKQWRRWESPTGKVDQLAAVVEEIRRNPDSRRLVVSAVARQFIKNVS